MAIISCNNLIKYYPTSEAPIINGVSLDIDEGSFVSITGRSGSGKSTLLKLLCGLLAPDGGSVECAGFDPGKLRGRELSRFRSTVIGIVFQDNNLIGDFSVWDNIMTPLYIAGARPDKAYTDRLIDITGVGGLLKRMPASLSGGQRQKAAVARALIAKPKVLFADEPTGNLDSQSELEVMRLFCEAGKEFGTTIVQVTHSGVCAGAGDRVVRIEDGRVGQI